jgi:hypothetical protein
MVVILGRMHFLIDFVSCVRALMAGSGLKQILLTSFGSVQMLPGTKYQQNIWAL